MTLDLTSVNVGSAPNDGEGAAPRDGMIIVNQNFAAVQEAFNDALLPAQNVISKTLKNSDGDFSTWDEFYDWFVSHSFGGAYVELDVSVGTFAATPGKHYRFYGSNCAYLLVRGSGKGATFIEYQPDDEGYWCDVEHSGLEFENLALRPAEAAGAYTHTFIGWNASIILNNVACIDSEVVMWLRRKSYGLITGGTTVVAQSGGQYDSFAWVSDDSTLDVKNGSFDGDTAGGNYGIWVESGKVYFRTGTNQIENCGVALSIDYEGLGGQITIASGQLTLTGNSSDYDVTVNEIRGDGGYISNGGPLTLAT